MTGRDQTPQDFSEIKQRLEQIADAVGDDELPLERALDLFEEAVTLGLQVSDALEEGLDDAVDPEGVDEAGASSAARESM